MKKTLIVLLWLSGLAVIAWWGHGSPSVAGWPWLLLAGAWSLGCGGYLRHGWAASADAALASELEAARRDALQWQANAASARGQAQALEADIVTQRNRVADVEAASAAEWQMLTMRLASKGAKAAALEAQCVAAESAATDVRAQAEADRAAAAVAAAELAAARNAWDIERATLADELDLKLAAQEREHAQALAGAEYEAATLAAEVMHLTHVQLRADDLLAQLETTQAALRAKDDVVSMLEGRLLPLTARVEVAESELAMLRRKLADRDAVLTRLWTEASRPAPAPDRHDDLKCIEGIGPKIELLLNAAGYRRFSDVAQADPTALAAVLEKSGPRFALARTDTWPEQARLLAHGDKEAFRRLIDGLKGGIRR